MLIKSRKIKHLLFSLTLLLATFPALEAQIVIDEDWERAIVEQEFQYLPVTDNFQPDIEKIIEGQLDSLFRPYESGFFSGKENENWLKLEISNELQVGVDLVLFTSRFDYIDLYWKEPFGSITHKQAGIKSTKLYDEYEVIDGYQYLNFSIQPRTENQTVYINIRNKDLLQGPQPYVPLTLARELKFLQERKQTIVFTSIFIGAVGIMFLYNLLLFLITRIRAYMYYFLYNFSVVMFVLALIPEYAIPIYGNMDINSGISTLTGISTLFFYVLFGRDIMETKVHYPRWDRLMQWCLGLLLISAGLNLAGLYLPSLFINFTTALFLYPSLFIIGLIMSRRGHRPSQYFFLASAIYIICQYIMIMMLLGVLPPRFWGLEPGTVMEIGALTELWLLSISLAALITQMRHRVTEEKLEKERILREKEEERKQVLEEQNRLLEKTVEERTREVVEQRDALKKSLEELKLTQTKLVESEKMASLGQLTAGVAHEINNPVNFISNGISNLKINLEEIVSSLDKYRDLNPKADIGPQLDEIEAFNRSIELPEAITDAKGMITSIENGVDRTVRIIKSLRNFSRLDEEKFKLADIHEGLESTLEILRSQIKKKAEVEKNYGEIPRIMCFPGKLNQVFMNLLSNAAQAIENRGVITITTRMEGSDWVCIDISDTGAGMSKEVKDKIFDPFFTTKPVGKGTGMGLSITYKIIEEHEGKIKVESEPGKGTTFHIRIPARLD